MSEPEARRRRRIRASAASPACSGSARPQWCSTRPGEGYVEVVGSLRGAGFDDVRRSLRGRLPTPHGSRRSLMASSAERFEVVVSLLSLGRRARLRLRVQVPEADPTLPDAVLRPPRQRGDGAGGLRHVRHPLRRPPGHDPHPDAGGLGGPPAPEGLLRRPGARAVQGCPGTEMSTGPTATPRVAPACKRTGPPTPTSPSDTSTTRGGDHRAPRARDGGGLPGAGRPGHRLRQELAIEEGAVLRIPEGLVLDPGNVDVEFGPDETMIINMGPQHPSTHGVLRIMLELEGETVLRSKPVIGYLHTGMEKTGEELTYVQGATNVTRMDYLSPLHNELVFSLAVEELLELEIPPRATWIRMLMSELNRISSHVMWAATNGMDLASTIDDDLRLSRAGDGALVLREDDRPADEPQLHPPGRRGGRPARRVGGRRRRHHRHDPGPRSTSTTSCSPASRSSASGPRASGSSARAGAGDVGHRARSCGPTGVPWDLRRDHAVPLTTTRSTSTSSSARSATPSTATPCG